MAAFCTNCGSELTPGTRFCGDCGTSAAPTAPPPPPPAQPRGPRPVLPPPPTAAQQGILGGDFSFDPARLLAGNWLGSAMVAGIMLAVAGALSVVLGLLAKPDDFGVDNTLTLGMMILAGTFGADAFFDGEIADEDLEMALSTSTYPLTVTVVTLLIGVVAFRRMVRDYPSALPALGDAARVGLFTGVPLFVGALISAATSTSWAAAGSGTWTVSSAGETPGPGARARPARSSRRSSWLRSCSPWPASRSGVSGGPRRRGRRSSGSHPRSRALP